MEDWTWDELLAPTLHQLDLTETSFQICFLSASCFCLGQNVWMFTDTHFSLLIFFWEVQYCLNPGVGMGFTIVYRHMYVCTLWYFKCKCYSLIYTLEVIVVRYHQMCFMGKYHRSVHHAGWKRCQEVILVQPLAWTESAAGSHKVAQGCTPTALQSSRDGCCNWGHCSKSWSWWGLSSEEADGA